MPKVQRKDIPRALLEYLLHSGSTSAASTLWPSNPWPSGSTQIPRCRLVIGSNDSPRCRLRPRCPDQNVSDLVPSPDWNGIVILSMRRKPGEGMVFDPRSTGRTKNAFPRVSRTVSAYPGPAPRDQTCARREARGRKGFRAAREGVKAPVRNSIDQSL